MDSLKLSKVRRKADRPEKIPVTGDTSSLFTFLVNPPRSGPPTELSAALRWPHAELLDLFLVSQALAPCNLPQGAPRCPGPRRHLPSLRPIQVPRATSTAQAEATQDPQSPQRSAPGDVQGSQPPTHHAPPPSTTRLLNNVVAFPRRRAVKESATFIKDDASPFGIISTGKLKASVQQCTALHSCSAAGAEADIDIDTSTLN